MILRIKKMSTLSICESPALNYALKVIPLELLPGCGILPSSELGLLDEAMEFCHLEQTFKLAWAVRKSDSLPHLMSSLGPCSHVQYALIHIDS